MSKINLGIIGASPIAEQHLKVIQNIKNLNIFGITSRTNTKCYRLYKKYKINKIYNNYIEMVKDKDIDALMVLVSGNQIYNVSNDLIAYKKPLFIEKPPGLNPSETRKLCLKFKKYKTPNMIGFNRRFYSVFHKGKKIIENHGKLLGISVQSNERFWILKNIKSTNVLKKWIYLNGSHNIDLIRFFGGEVDQVRSSSYKYFSKQNNQFVASYKLKSGAIGTYQSSWSSPGMWSITLFGDGVSVIFSPLETGKIVNKKNEYKIIKPNIEDIKFKPGFYKQIICFKNLIINSKNEWPSQNFCESLKTMQLVKKIAKE